MGIDTLFCQYFHEWVETYKVGAVRQVTLNKYRQTQKQLQNIAPDVTMKQLDKRTYQHIINKYAETHSRQTVIDFNTHLKAVAMDAVDEGILPYNPARKVVIKGTSPQSKQKHLSIDECERLAEHLDLTSPIRNDNITFHPKGDIYKINWDWLILICLKTGLRFSEVLGLTPNDLDFSNNTLEVNKTYDYKYNHCLVGETKTASSVRKILMDGKLSSQLARITRSLAKDKPIFVVDGQRVFNSTVSSRLKTLCKSADIPTISIHGLRHTHASILFYSGVSIQSISRRLGHANVSVTQNIYLHIIKELEDEDNDKMLVGLSKIA